LFQIGAKTTLYRDSNLLLLCYDALVVCNSMFSSCRVQEPLELWSQANQCREQKTKLARRLRVGATLLYVLDALVMMIPMSSAAVRPVVLVVGWNPEPDLGRLEEDGLAWRA